jgi:hypothetical protein
VLVLCKKYQAPKRQQAVFAQNLKLFAQTRFGGPTLVPGCGDVTSLHKNLVKIEKTNFRRLSGWRLKSPLLLWLMHNSKAVAMGTVLVIAFFSNLWPTQPYYACFS